MMNELEFSMVQPNGKLVTYSFDKDKYPTESGIITMLDNSSKELLSVFEHLYEVKVNPYYLKTILELQCLLNNYKDFIIEQVWNNEFKSLSKIQNYQLN